MSYTLCVMGYKNRQKKKGDGTETVTVQSIDKACPYMYVKEVSAADHIIDPDESTPAGIEVFSLSSITDFTTANLTTTLGLTGSDATYTVVSQPEAIALTASAITTGDKTTYTTTNTTEDVYDISGSTTKVGLTVPEAWQNYTGWTFQWVDNETGSAVNVGAVVSGTLNTETELTDLGHHKISLQAISTIAGETTTVETTNKNGVITKTTTKK